MRSFLLLLLSTISFTLFGQQRPVFGIDFGIGVVIPSIKGDYPDSDGVLDRGSEFNLSMSLPLDNRFSFETGLGLNSIIVRQNYEGILSGCNIPVELGGTGLQTNARTVTSLFYVQIPLSFTYHFSADHKGFFWRGGANLLFDIGGESIGEWQECGEGDWDIVSANDAVTKSFVFLPRTSFGFEFKQGEDKRSFVELYVAIPTSNIIEADDLRQNFTLVPTRPASFVSFGLKFGLQIY